MKRAIALLIPLLAIGSSGCAGLLSSYDVTPSGLYRGDEELRRQLAQDRADAALSRVTSRHRSAPSDELLRLLYQGVTARYAGRYHEAAIALDRAAQLADDRRPPSASRTVLSIATNDRVLPYTAGTTERLFIHYYAAASYLEAGDMEGAAVEARRLAFLLQLLDGEGGQAERQRDAMLRYFTGTIFQATGDLDDARIAYRHAARLIGAPDDTVLTQLPDGFGEVVVFLEQGFIAHRAEESITLVLTPTEARAFTDAGGGDRTATAAAVAARILEDPAFRGDLQPQPGARFGSGYLDAGSSSDGAPYLLRVAWPTYRRDVRMAPAPTLMVGDSEPTTFRLAADLSESVMSDFRGERLGILTRSILRAAAKYALTQGVEERTRRRAPAKGDEDAEGDDGSEGERESWWLSALLGTVTNIGGAILEQADTRAWNLLPDRITIARIQLPEGEHTLRVTARAGIGVPATSVEIGSLQVRAGQLTFVSERVW